MKYFVFIAFFMMTSWAVALDQYTTSDLRDVPLKVQELVERYDSKEILIVYDLDNTLLAMQTDIGSDQWFDWQSSILTDEKNGDRVSDNFSGLLQVQGLLYNLGAMRLTQPDAPVILHSLKNSKIKQILLTSRGPDFRDVTEREIQRHDLPVWNGNHDHKITHGLPYDPQNLKKSCLSEQDKVTFKLSDPRLISVGKNIILSSGQHKGMILKTYLCKAPKRYKAILFIDDKQKNIDAMVAAYGSHPSVELVTFRYSREDGRVDMFHAGDKDQAKSDWSVLKVQIKSIFDKSF